MVVSLGLRFIKLMVVHSSMWMVDSNVNQRATPLIASLIELDLIGPS